MSTSSTLIWVQSLTVGNVVWPRTETTVVQSLSLSQGQSPSLETLEEPKPVRAFLSPLDHWRLGRHGNSGTLDLPPSASTLWARCLFSETISSWTYLHQLCKSFVTRGRCGTVVGVLVIRAYNPNYHVKSFLYTFNAYSGVILSFLITLGVTNYCISVCFIYCIINKSLGNIIISYLFMFFNIYITISYCLYHV